MGGIDIYWHFHLCDSVILQLLPIILRESVKNSPSAVRHRIALLVAAGAAFEINCKNHNQIKRYQFVKLAPARSLVRWWSSGREVRGRWSSRSSKSSRNSRSREKEEQEQQEQQKKGERGRWMDVKTGVARACVCQKCVLLSRAGDESITNQPEV